LSEKTLVVALIAQPGPEWLLKLHGEARSFVECDAMIAKAAKDVVARSASRTTKMNVEFRRAILPKERQSLVAFDRKAFKQDAFDAEEWSKCEAWWMLVDRRKVGCCAFEPHVDFQHDVREDDVNPHKKGSLFIVSTGILPDLQGSGLGTLMKAWQIAYARQNGFKRIVTNVRKSKVAMIELNKKFGFSKIRTTPSYYEDPIEPTVVMELVLARRGSRRRSRQRRTRQR
jgi:ribosomal protein S18 acetylase RimI-like enzyme